jgi:hypothetical protein
MNLEDRIAAFEKLGNYLSAIDRVAFEGLTNKAKNENSWFTTESIERAFKGLRSYLKKEHLQQWVSAYGLQPSQERTVAVVMAGNIPLVGFHDFMAVLVSGHTLQMKLSSKDSVLLSHIAEKLVEIEPTFSRKIILASQLWKFEAVIATGSDNSSRYFEYYFGKYPHIIRKNRTSVAVLTGKETAAELEALGKDVFDYFGLGCRNVSKLFVPRDFDLKLLLDSWSGFQPALDHHKYHNNYDYQKSILLVNSIPFLDSGFVLLRENENLVSPIAVVYYETYHDEGDLALKLTASKEKIQCVVGKVIPGAVPFGHAQSPMLWDYADQIDTLKFLDNLN